MNEDLPTEDGGYQMYKAAGKLSGKKALITGGDSGIGRAIAILFAMEGADSFIAFLPQEEKDAQETKEKVEQYGHKCHLFPIDLREAKNCKATIDKALEAMGGINILVLNHATQKTVDFIADLSEYAYRPLAPPLPRHILTMPRDQWLETFDTNIHPYVPKGSYLRFDS